MGSSCLLERRQDEEGGSGTEREGDQPTQGLRPRLLLEAGAPGMCAERSGVPTCRTEGWSVSTGPSPGLAPAFPGVWMPPHCRPCACKQAPAGLQKALGITRETRDSTRCGSRGHCELSLLDCPWQPQLKLQGAVGLRCICPTPRSRPAPPGSPP